MHVSRLQQRPSIAQFPIKDTECILVRMLLPILICYASCLVSTSHGARLLFGMHLIISNISLVPCLSSIAYISTLELEHGEILAASYKSHIIERVVRQAYKGADCVF